MEKDGGVFLAEAKHFQVRDWLVYFVADRLEGLALKTGMLKHSGLSVQMASKYSQQRDNILAHRASWRAKTRQALTETEFLSWVRSRPTNADAQIEIMHGLFALEHSKLISPGRVLPSINSRDDAEETVRWCLDRLKRELNGKLTQIKGFMEATGAHAVQAVVFFSGIDEWEPEWSVVWEALDANDQAAWKQVSGIKQAANQLIGIPFELIVGRFQKQAPGPNGGVHYGSVQYLPFPWRSGNVIPIRSERIIKFSA